MGSGDERYVGFIVGSALGTVDGRGVGKTQRTFHEGRKLASLVGRMVGVADGLDDGN